ncbi:MAG: energy transducer TonB [Flavobacterium sp.]
MKSLIALFLFGATLVFAQEVNMVKDGILIPKVELYPIFPGCEDLEASKQPDCFQEKLKEHLQKNQTYPKEAIKQKIQGRVYVTFIIDKQGDVVINHVRAPHESLGKEAKRVILLLPKMKPGMYQGNAIDTPFTIPLLFRFN